MKYLKLYEDFEFNEDDFDFEEEDENVFISDNNFKIIKYRYNDDYSYGGYRYWLFDKHEGKSVKFFNPDKITYASGERGEEITKDEIEKIKNGTIWITNNNVTHYSNFRKWKYDELKDKFYITNI